MIPNQSATNNIYLQENYKRIPRFSIRGQYLMEYGRASRKDLILPGHIIKNTDIL